MESTEVSLSGPNLGQMRVETGFEDRMMNHQQWRFFLTDGRDMNNLCIEGRERGRGRVINGTFLKE